VGLAGFVWAGAKEQEMSTWQIAKSGWGVKVRFCFFFLGGATLIGPSPIFLERSTLNQNFT